MLAGIEGQRDGHNAEAASRHSDHLRRSQFAIHQHFDIDIAVSAVVFCDEVDFKGLARLENFFIPFSPSLSFRNANRRKAIALLISLYRHSQKETMENPVLIFVNFSTDFCSSFGRNIQSASKCIKKRPAQVLPRVGRFLLNCELVSLIPSPPPWRRASGSASGMP